MKKALIIGATVLTVGMAPLGILANSPAVTTAKAEVSLSDVKGHWAQNEIEFLVSEGVISGYPDGSYRPEGTVTRAQFSKILASLMGVESDVQAFFGLDGHWSETKVNGLVEAGIIYPNEYPGGFGPGTDITRLEMSKMVARGLAKESGLWNEVLTGFEQLEAIKLPFKDQNQLGSGDMPYVALANSSGIVNGFGNGTFKADGLATRAQAAVMLKRYLNTKDKVPALSQLLEEFKGEPSIHDYTKEEMEEWIDREGDLERLRNIPTSNEYFDYDLAKENSNWMNDKYRDMESMIEKYYHQPVVRYMDIYFNRDYRTIGEAFIEDLKYYIRSSQTHRGVFYSSYENLPELFDLLVKETKDEKRISESIFVSDITTVYSNPSHGSPRIRGTQYIRYTSGTNLPKGVELNKWYKRDIDVQLASELKLNGSLITWENSTYGYEDIIPITNYAEVTENSTEQVPPLNYSLGQFKGNVNELSKDELQKKIDKKADLDYIRSMPVNYELFENDLPQANKWLLEFEPESELTMLEIVNSYYQPAVGFMEKYFDRDYHTIGEQFKKDIRYYFRGGFEYKFRRYSRDGLNELFDRFIQETKEEERISESIFVSDLSTFYQSELDRRNIARGMQYIRYTSGTNLPKGVELNKWYKRVVDVQFSNLTVEVSWETAPTVLTIIEPVTFYQEVLN